MRNLNWLVSKNMLRCLTAGLSAVFWVSLVGCGGGSLSPNPGETAAPPDMAVPVVLPCAEGTACDDGDACTVGDHCHAGHCAGAPAASCGLTVQEWGTYTSVEASDGHPLGGVHHVDEALPNWVHSRNWNNSNSYFFEALPEEPLQQLETPVLYFFTASKTQAHIEIGFPKGVVGEWYPEAKSFVPAINHCTAIAGGSMTWDVTLDPAIAPETFAPVDPTNIWAPSRNVASTPVRYQNMNGVKEDEQFIFYRGLGTFDPPVHVDATVPGQLRIKNASTDDLAAVFVLDVGGSGAQIVSLGALRAGETRAAAIPAATQPLEKYVLEAQQILRQALMQSGLRDDVATAMVETWTRSWFKNAGIRVLYIAPRKWTDGWLPTQITPAPTSLVRTLVGRIESLTPAEENALIQKIHQRAPTGMPLDLAALGRFAEPRLRRALEAMTDPTEKSYTQSMVDQAHALP